MSIAPASVLTGIHYFLSQMRAHLKTLLLDTAIYLITHIVEFPKMSDTGVGSSLPVTKQGQYIASSSLECCVEKDSEDSSWWKRMLNPFVMFARGKTGQGIVSG